MPAKTGKEYLKEYLEEQKKYTTKTEEEKIQVGKNKNKNKREKKTKENGSQIKQTAEWEKNMQLVEYSPQPFANIILYSIFSIGLTYLELPFAHKQTNKQPLPFFQSIYLQI